MYVCVCFIFVKHLSHIIYIQIHENLSDRLGFLKFSFLVNTLLVLLKSPSSLFPRQPHVFGLYMDTKALPHEG